MRGISPLAAVAALVAGLAAGFAAGLATGTTSVPEDAAAPPTGARPSQGPASAKPARASNDDAESLRRLRSENRTLRKELEAARDAAEPRAAGSGAGAGVPSAHAPYDAAALARRALGGDLTDATAKAALARAERYRREAENSLAQAEARAAYEIADEVRAERERAEDRTRNGAMNLLATLRREWTTPPLPEPTRPWELLRSADRFGALFRTHTPPVAVKVVTDGMQPPVPDGAVISYPAGQFRTHWSGLSGRAPFPRDVTIQGAGMDATLLVAESEIDTRRDVDVLTFRDLTIHTHDQYLTAFRSNSATVRMEGCRVVGFDMGAGASCAIAGTGVAFSATGCRFEGGFGRSPGSGNLFDVRGALIARFDRCVFVGPLNRVWDHGAVVFTGCRFEGFEAGFEKEMRRNGLSVELADCTFAPLPAGAEPSEERRSLASIVPGWKDP